MSRLTRVIVKSPSVATLCLAAACSHQPPRDFAPDPGLVARIREIELRAPQWACPGQSFPVTYTAVLDDGSRVPFESRYDKKHPPPLHVVFLLRQSAEATPLEDGGWTADRHPLLSARTGFRLGAALRANPAVSGSATVAPDYSCDDHTFRFEGATGDRSEAGVDGPEVTVRVGIVRSPFYDQLLVAAVEVADAPPLFLLADARAVPPADWLLVESRGGRGGRGASGTRGLRGSEGAPGCPAGSGGPGGAGGSGGPGGAGGRGGRITVIAPEEEPFLAGLVDARVPGGDGGPGGAGGAGGAAGPGGAAKPTGDQRNCQPGQPGAEGASGRAGPKGLDGDPGPRSTLLTVPLRSVFGTRAPAELIELLDLRPRRMP